MFNGIFYFQGGKKLKRKLPDCFFKRKMPNPKCAAVQHIA